MMRYLFLSDLDRTLIFSYNRLTPDDERICAETKGEKELSFMTHHSADMLKSIVGGCEFIPVTSRSEEQYKRIFLPFGITPRYAVIDNGANLLIDGVPDEEWNKEFQSAFAAAEDEIALCKEYLSACENTYFEIRIVDGSFLFTKCRDSDNVLLDIKDKLSPQFCDIFTNGDKLYVIPTGISKQRALSKIKERFPDHTVIAAGDSLFDEDMLRAADIAVVNKGELCDMQLCEHQFSYKDGENDTEFVTDTVSKILTGGVNI